MSSEVDEKRHNSENIGEKTAKSIEKSFLRKIKKISRISNKKTLKNLTLNMKKIKEIFFV